jgi:hypothetical protein
MRTLVVTLALALPAAALAQTAAECQQPRDVDKYQLLRRLSLDLRGRIPDVTEYEALDAQSAVPASVIRSYLSSDDFRLVMRRYHEELFWPNLSNLALANVNAQLVVNGTTNGPPDVWLLSSTARRRTFRGVTDANTAHGLQCGDYEQTHFLPGGGFRPDPAFIRTTVVNGVTVRQEGWRLVTPYWSTTPIKVCAYDAQETETVTVGTGAAARTLSCGHFETNGNPACGCGVGLKFCYGPTASVRNVITASAREQVGLLVDRVSTGGRPYTDLVLSRVAPVNGPLAFWKQNLASNLSVNRIWAMPDPTEPPTNKAFSDLTWTDVDRGTDLHAGVLTTTAYLLRFQTNRARGNRYRIDFECESYVPPSRLEEPAADNCSASSDDLTKRCTCRGCHRGLEPLASHWGQFAEGGTTLLTDLIAWPRTRMNCVGSTNAVCNRFYVTNPDADNAGALQPYQYADAQHPELAPALARGPRKRVNESIANGTFARCVVKRTWSSLMKRDLRLAGPGADEGETLDQLATGFTSNNYSLPWLVEQIVSKPQYRRVR